MMLWQGLRRQSRQEWHKIWDCDYYYICCWVASLGDGEATRFECGND